MPTTDEDGSVQEADLDDEGALPAGPEEMRPGTPTERSWGGWSEQEWKRWNAYCAWSAPSGDPGVGSGDGARAASSLGPTASAASTASQEIGHDPWWGNQGDPWQGREDRRGGAGGQDKIQVPEYNGEDDRDGLNIRKIEAWRRVTRLTRPKQALMLYNNLTGRAWRDAEELELGLLDSEVEVFVGWIKSNYMDREVTKIGRYMSDFFKVLKRNTQSAGHPGLQPGVRPTG